MNRCVIFLLVLIFLTAGCSSAPATTKQELPNQQELPPPEPKTVPSPYTGVRTDPERVNRRPIAVMIDNSPKARPQHGLAAASIVYEMLAEGGITRYMAIYLEGEAETVGPVRSARHYFVYAAAGHDAVYAHCGGSPQAYREIAGLSIRSLDDMKDRGIFRRSNDRSAPHNLYTSIATLRKEMAARGWEKTQAPEPLWKFTDESGQGKPATYVRIPYPKGYQGYSVRYEFDQESGTYKRYVADAPHVDASDRSQIRAKSIIVLFIKSWPIPKDPELRIDMDIVGSGSGILFVDGKQRDIKWSKASKTGPFCFSESNGEPLKMQRGNVWIQVVPLETQVESR